MYQVRMLTEHSDRMRKKRAFDKNYWHEAKRPYRRAHSSKRTDWKTGGKSGSRLDRKMNTSSNFTVTGVAWYVIIYGVYKVESRLNQMADMITILPA